MPRWSENQKDLYSLNAKYAHKIYTTAHKELTAVLLFSISFAKQLFETFGAGAARYGELVSARSAQDEPRKQAAYEAVARLEEEVRDEWKRKSSIFETSPSERQADVDQLLKFCRNSRHIAAGGFVEEAHAVLKWWEDGLKYATDAWNVLGNLETEAERYYGEMEEAYKAIESRLLTPPRGHTSEQVIRYIVNTAWRFESILEKSRSLTDSQGSGDQHVLAKAQRAPGRVYKLQQDAEKYRKRLDKQKEELEKKSRTSSKRSSGFSGKK